jgi:hypothetical protein
MMHSSLSSCASALGVSVNTLGKWRKWDGFPPKTEEGWDEEAIRAWYPGAIKARRKVKQRNNARAATLAAKKDTKPKAGEAGFDDFESAQKSSDEEKRWSAAYRKAKAMREMLELQRIRGEMVPRQDVERMFANRVFEVTARLEAMPKTLAPQLEGLTPLEIASKIAEHVRSIREHFARSPKIEGEDDRRSRR